MNTNWDRKQLKANGKALFKVNYWKCVLTALILGALSGGGAASYRFNNSDVNSYVQSGSSAIGEIPTSVWGIMGGVFAGVFLISLAISLFVINPLKVGCYRFYTENHYAPAELNELGFGFTHNYINNVKTMFFMNLYLVLWTLLFIVPGIIKSYSYKMVPYIIAENPDMDSQEVITLSRQMMDGNKWNAFVLDLSFLGWLILSVFTFGILAIFYVSPYMESTYSELYHTLKPVSGDEQGIEAEQPVEQPVEQTVVETTDEITL